jgi:dTDP-4-amino-4,6-dideoxygalactose transaminase
LNSFHVVDQFEQRVAEFAGSKYAVATSTGTAALFLSCYYTFHARWANKKAWTILPARTFISVPMAVIQAGGTVEFDDEPWSGIYRIFPWSITDGALRFRRGMYDGGLHCLSFHARKLLNIGEGGMILTDNGTDADWLRAARYSGRCAPHYRIEDVDMLGFQLYMTPEKAARGLHLMDYIRDDLPDQVMEYPDLRTAPFFQKEKV